MCDELFKKAVNAKDYKNLDDLAPFINKETLSVITDEKFARGGLKHFENIVPFLNSEKLRVLARTAIEKDGIKAISPIAPFLGREFLAGYVRQKYL